MIVRADLPLGNLAAQLVHAAAESAIIDPLALTPGTHVVVLAALDENDLLDVHKRLEISGIRLVLIREPDPPFFMAATAIGCVPGQRDQLRKLLRNRPLLGKEKPCTNQL